jgi:uncharacterized membrane protein
MLLALSPFHIFFSQDTRPYTLMFTLVVLTLWVLHRALETNGALWWVAHGACILALLYLHFFDWSIVAGEVLYILLCWRRYRRGLVPFGLSLLACVLAVPPVYNLLLDSQGIGRLLVLDAVPVSISFASTWKTLATGESWYVSRLVRSVAVVALGLLGMAGCVHWGRRQPRVLVLMLSMLAVPFLSVFVVLRVLGYVVPPYEERQFMIVLPIVLVLVASGVEFLRRSQGPRVAAKLGPALAACLLVVLLGSNVMALGGYYTRFEKNRDIRVIEYLASRVEPGDAIICQGSSMAMNIEFHWDEGIPVELVAYPLSVDGDWRFSRRLSIVPVDSLQWDVSMDDLLSHPRVWLVAQDGFDSPEFATEMQNVAPLVLVAPVAPFTVYLFAP